MITWWQWQKINTINYMMMIMVVIITYYSLIRENLFNIAIEEWNNDRLSVSRDLLPSSIRKENFPHSICKYSFHLRTSTYSFQNIVSIHAFFVKKITIMKHINVLKGTLSFMFILSIGFNSRELQDDAEYVILQTNLWSHTFLIKICHSDKH